MAFNLPQEEHDRLRKAGDRLAKRQKRSGIVNDYKRALGCSECGEHDPLLLDFHHIDETNKHFTISEKMHTVSMERLWAEVALCRILCVSCHRRHHAKTH